MLSLELPAVTFKNMAQSWNIACSWTFLSVKYFFYRCFLVMISSFIYRHKSNSSTKNFNPRHVFSSSFSKITIHLTLPLEEELTMKRLANFSNCSTFKTAVADSESAYQQMWDDTGGKQARIGRVTCHCVSWSPRW